jgi:hypothetical protein
MSCIEEPRVELVKPLIPADCKICGDEEGVDNDKHDGMCFICYREEAYKEAEQRPRPGWYENYDGYGPDLLT